MSEECIHFTGSKYMHSNAASVNGMVFWRLSEIWSCHILLVGRMQFASLMQILVGIGAF